MHSLVVMASLLLALLFGYAALAMLPRVNGWPERRAIQILVLAAPVLSLSVALDGVRHMAGRICFLGAPPWDYLASVAVPAAVALLALGGFGFGIVRLALTSRWLTRDATAAPLHVRALAHTLAITLGVPRPRVLLRPSDHPQALTWGLGRPTVLLSTWMVNNLDQGELEAVLAHEIGHAARSDYAVNWLASVLRDAFFYVPTSWVAWRQLHTERETACDDLAVAATKRPLALASALAKVWHYALTAPAVPVAQSLTAPAVSIEGRIERLLKRTESASAKPSVRSSVFGVGTAALVGLATVQAVALLEMLTPMGCGLGALLRGIV